MAIQGGHYQWKIQPIEYGCNDGNKCYKVGDIIQGRCYQAECKLNTNKTVVYLDVIRGACEWNNTCYQDNDVWTDGCVDYKCVISRQEAEVKWGVETVRLGCRDFNNKCLAVGEI